MRRKEWLFSNKPKESQSIAFKYSLVETLKENNLKPYDYIKYLLDLLPQVDNNDTEAID